MSLSAIFENGQGYKPRILVWPGQEKDSAGKATSQSWIEYDLVPSAGSQRKPVQ
jgi:hypothetical protein